MTLVLVPFRRAAGFGDDFGGQQGRGCWFGDDILEVNRGGGGVCWDSQNGDLGWRLEGPCAWRDDSNIDIMTGVCRRER